MGTLCNLSLLNPIFIPAKVWFTLFGLSIERGSKKLPITNQFPIFTLSILKPFFFFSG